MAAKIDLTNQVFERLTVIKENGRDKSGAILWECRCECGTIKTVRGNDLRSGKIKSCGCLGKEKRLQANQQRREKNINNPTYYNDLSNQKFGRLLVLEFDKEYTIKKQQELGNKNSWWKCQCDCGNIIYVNSSSLKSGHTRSCGCLQKDKAKESIKKIQPIGVQTRFIDLTGQRFGKLIVISRTENRGEKVCWKCKCDCGGIIEATSTALMQGDTCSCGCLKQSRGEEKIKQILVDNNIKFIQEVKFFDLKDKQNLRFDFGILNENNEIIKLIEFDGEQHTNKNNPWYSENMVIHDKMKNEYCINKNIPLLRISYTTDLNKLTLKDLI